MTEREDASLSGLAAQRAVGDWIIFYDGECGLCGRFVQFTISRDPDAKFRFAPRQSDLGKRWLRELGVVEARHTLVVVMDSRVDAKSAALLRVLQQLAGPWRYAALLAVLPGAITDLGYDMIARTRYRRLDCSDRCYPVSPDLRRRFLR